MRMPQAKSGYQRAELSKSQPFPPPCGVTLRGCLGCWSLTRDPGVLAPAQLPSPCASAAGDIPELSPLGLGILGWETHPAITSCLGTPRFWCTQDGMDSWTAGSSLHQPLARAAWSAETHRASCPPRCSPMQGPAWDRTSAGTVGDTYSSPWMLGPRDRVWLCKA